MIQKLLRVMNILFQLHLPIMSDTVFFQSFHGQYNDNPKYISEKLYQMCPGIKIVWAIGDGKENDFPSYVKLVRLNSMAYGKYVSRAKVVVDNYYGCRSSLLENPNYLNSLISKHKARARRGQLRISTWHGMPFKHIALDEPKYKEMPSAQLYHSTDILLAGDKITAYAFRTAFRWERDVLMSGTPRNDLLFNCNDEIKKKLKEKLGLPLDKKIIVFAPTFRNSVEMSGLKQINEIDIPELENTFEERFSGKWCFVFRSHNEVMKKYEEHGLLLENIIDGNKHQDMAEYLACCDALITDYSSCMFDFALTKKPCFLYTPDLDHYCGMERGFYFDIHELPFPIAQNLSELIRNVYSFQLEQYRNDVEKMLERFGSVEDGKATLRVVNRIMKCLGKV